GHGSGLRTRLVLSFASETAWWCAGWLDRQSLFAAMQFTEHDLVASLDVDRPVALRAARRVGNEDDTLSGGAGEGGHWHAIQLEHHRTDDRSWRELEPCTLASERLSRVNVRRSSPTSHYVQSLPEPTPGPQRWALP